MDFQFPWKGVRDALLSAAYAAREEAEDSAANPEHMDRVAWEQTSEKLYEAYIWLARLTRDKVK